MERPSRTVLVLGGGVGGVVAANRLRRLLPRRDRVVLVSWDPQHLFQPSLLWLAVGQRTAAAIQRPLERLRRKGIEVRIAEVRSIDPVARRVVTSEGELTGDAIVISLGAKLAPEAIPGLVTSGYDLYTLAGASALRTALECIEEGRVVVLTAAPTYKCPAAPYEAAMLIDGELRRRGVRDRVSVEFHAAEPGPMGVAGPAVSAQVRAMVESKGIGYHPGRQVTSVDSAARELTFADGSVVSYDILVAVPPHRPPDVVKASGLAGATGWVEVDRETFETAHPGVFAIGDITTVPLAVGKPLPKAGVFAHAAAEVVAHNIAAAWGRGGVPRRFSGAGDCFLETGAGRAGIGGGEFYAEPVPLVRMRAPSRWWHWAKVAFERWWFVRWL
jgi:sulfide:quinone oxidoreductase